MSTTKVQGDMIDVDAATVAVVAAGDKFNFLDITDSLVKEDTIQGIVDLAGGGAWSLIGTEEAPGGSGTPTLDVTGLDSTYDTYAICFSALLPITDNQPAFLRFGDSGGIDSGASDYAWLAAGDSVNGTTYAHVGLMDNADSEMQFNPAGGFSGGAAGEGIGAVVYLHRPGDSPMYPTFSGTKSAIDEDTILRTTFMGGGRLSAITLDRVQFLFASGNVESGRMSVFGIAHA
jgi:hypothetical protein